MPGPTIDHNALIVKFAADLEALQAGVAEVNSLLVTKVEKELDKAGKAGNDAGKKVKAGFKDAGDGLRLVSVLLGQQSAAIVQVGTQLAQFSGELGSSLKSGAGRITLIAAAVVGVSAGVAVIAKNWELVKTKTELYWESLKSLGASALAAFERGLRAVQKFFGGSGYHARLRAEELEKYAEAARKAAIDVEAYARRIQVASALQRSASDAIEEYEKKNQALSNVVRALGGSVEVASQRVANLKALIQSLAQSGDPKYAEDIQKYTKELKTAEETLRVLKSIEDDRNRDPAQTIDEKLAEAAKSALQDYELQIKATDNATQLLGESVQGLEDRLHLINDTMKVLAADGTDNYIEKLFELGAEHQKLTEKIAKEKFRIELDPNSFDKVEARMKDFAAKTREILDFKSQFTAGETLGLADALLPESEIATISERQAQVRMQFVEWYDSLRVTGEDFLVLTQGVVDQFTTGIGNAVAQVAVYGADVAETATNLLKSLAASVISSLVTMLAQQIAFQIIGFGLLKKKAAAEIGTASSIASAWAAAAAVRELGLVGIALAPGFSALAATAVAVGAVAGYGTGAGTGNSLPIGAAARGAYVTGPTLMLVGEREPEVIAPRSQYEAMLDSGGRGQTIVVPVNLDGRQIAQVVARNWQGVMNQQGIKGR